jgi:N-acetylglucosaminyldiphosphoundecaprenol N-acetyl-beta-D-mannosaminyltransferase
MKCSFGKIKVDNVSMQEAVAAIVGMAQKSEIPRLVCTANLDHLATAECDQEFRSIYREADFVVADGMPLVWLSCLTHCRLKERVAGSDLFWELGRASEATGLRLFLLGGKPGSAAMAALMLTNQYPGAQVVGTYCPPYGTLDDKAELVRIKDAVSSAAPDVLLVGFGSPRQEKWIAAYKDMLAVPVSIGVGGSFDMAAGIVQRAPRWMRSVGLEWVFRLGQEPRRLFSRYFGRDLPFFGWLFVTLLADRLVGFFGGKPPSDQLA